MDVRGPRQRERTGHRGGGARGAARLHSPALRPRGQRPAPAHRRRDRRPNASPNAPADAPSVSHGVNASRKRFFVARRLGCADCRRVCPAECDRVRRAERAGHGEAVSHPKPTATPGPSPTAKPTPRPSRTPRPSASNSAAAFQLPANPQSASASLDNGQGNCNGFPSGGVVIATSFRIPNAGQLTATSPLGQVLSGRISANGTFSLAGQSPEEAWSGRLTASGGSGSYSVVSNGCTETYATTITFT